jgi:hypothetical protein
MMDSEHNDKEILRQLETGEIDVEEAVRRLEEEDTPGEVDVQPTAAKSGFEPPTHWQNWWLIPMLVGLIALVGGYLLSQVGGWWWVCAAPTLLLGLVVVTLAAVSINSPWVHVRVKSTEKGAGSNVRVSLPLPLGLTGFFLRRFGHFAGDSLDKTMVDEILVALERDFKKSGDPIYIEVDDDESGEKVEVYLG